MWALYGIADFFFFILYVLIGYRKDVVMKNLAIAFPEKTEEERKKIARQFYRNFCDNWIEAIKLFSISKRTLNKRVTADYSEINALYKKGKSCQLHLGHMFNWEWGNVHFALHTPYKWLGVYAPISSKIFNRLFLHLRNKFNTVLLPANDMKRAMLPHRGTQYALGLAADQNPSNPFKCYWLNFFDTKTAFMYGPERGARAGNIPVIYIELTKPRRGYYHIQAILLEEDPAETKEGELTLRYVRLLERTIRNQPDIYLWTHKRWKHHWSEEYSSLWIE